MELSGLKGGRFSAEDSTSSGHKGSGWGLLGKAANTCSLFRGHNGEVKLQPPPPVGLSCPGFAGTQRGAAKGVSWSKVVSRGLGFESQLSALPSISQVPNCVPGSVLGPRDPSVNEMETTHLSLTF